MDKHLQSVIINMLQYVLAAHKGVETSIEINYQSS